MRSLLLWLQLKVIPIFSSDMLKNLVSVRVILGLSNTPTHNYWLINMFPIIRSVQQCFHLPYYQYHCPVSFFSGQSLNPDECLTDIEITEQIIIDSIQELSSTYAAGPDGVLSSQLLKCAAELAPFLKIMFSQSLTHSFIPSSLKTAAITPVFKSGTKTSPSNYRPISLTSTIIKVFELIIRKQVVAFMNRQGHLNNTQQGFRSGRSCLSALLDVFDDLMHMLSSDTTVDMIYLDYNLQRKLMLRFV